MPTLDLSADVLTLTAAVCDIPSVSRNEQALADAVEAALRPLPHLKLQRQHNTIVAQTDLGRAERVLLAGHLDTVPLTDPANLPVRRVDGRLIGRGTTDMKAGVAVQLKLAATLSSPTRDVTYVFYESEEIEEEFNGLRHLAATRPEWLAADFAVLLEPTDGAVEGGCKGTLRVDVTTSGRAAHSARPWRGHNAIHDAAQVLQRLCDYQPRTVVVDGLEYIEALNAVGITGGIAGNVIPDACCVSVNYRFAPTTSAAEALEHVREVFAGFEVTVTDSAEGGLPGLGHTAAQAFVAALGMPVRAKQGWTDVARLSSLGVPAVNFGPGDPNLAHADDEWCAESQIVEAEALLRRWLTQEAE